MAEGLPINLEAPATSVSFVGTSLALVILEAEPGEKNVLVLGPGGDEVARLGTTCGTGSISEVLDVQDEIRVIEAARDGDFQARLDLGTLTLERVAEWR